jgi:hypothetical protein
MSIHNIFHKIKSRVGLDNITIVYLLVIIGVGIGSFAMGRLSVSDIYNRSENMAQVKQESFVESVEENNVDISITEEMQLEKRYVASKNGKMYYPLGCSGAKRIKPENEVWFSTTEEAEKSGYTKSSTCK